MGVRSVRIYYLFFFLLRFIEKETNEYSILVKSMIYHVLNARLLSYYLFAPSVRLYQSDGFEYSRNEKYTQQTLQGYHRIHQGKTHGRWHHTKGDGKENTSSPECDIQD